MSYLAQKRTWFLFEDTELHLIHAAKECPDAKIASKYKYLKSIDLKEGDTEHAGQIDARAKACERCKKRERAKRLRLRNYKSPPGFR